MNNVLSTPLIRLFQECQKGFRTASELTLHKAIHVEVKQYKCEFCGKEFRTKGCIKSHIKYHIGENQIVTCNNGYY